MFGLMLFATLWFPLFYLLKYFKTDNINVTHMLGFYKDSMEAEEIKNINEKTMKFAMNTYYRLQFTIIYNGETYNYNCLTRQCEWPPNWNYTHNDYSWIKRAVLYHGSNMEDVTDIVCRHGGPRGDFYSKYVNFSWIFPYFKQEEIESYVKIYSNNDSVYKINLLNNGEDENKEDELTKLYDVKLLDNAVEDFILEEI